jgi:hypothetical protein
VCEELAVYEVDELNYGNRISKVIMKLVNRLKALVIRKELCVYMALFGDIIFRDSRDRTNVLNSNGSIIALNKRNLFWR